MSTPLEHAHQFGLGPEDLGQELVVGGIILPKRQALGTDERIHILAHDRGEVAPFHGRLHGVKLMVVGGEEVVVLWGMGLLREVASQTVLLVLLQGLGKPFVSQGLEVVLVRVKPERTASMVRSDFSNSTTKSRLASAGLRVPSDFMNSQPSLLRRSAGTDRRNQKNPVLGVFPR